MRREEFSGLRQRRPPTAASAIEQARPRESFERGDLVADRRLRVAEFLRCARNRTCLRDSLERCQVAGIETRPKIKYLYRVRLQVRLLRSYPLGRLEW